MHVIITSLCPAKVMWRHGFHLTERGDRQRVRDGLRGTLGAPPGHCFCPHHLHPLPNTKGQQTQRLWAKSEAHRCCPSQQGSTLLGQVFSRTFLHPFLQQILESAGTQSPCGQRWSISLSTSAHSMGTAGHHLQPLLPRGVTQGV